MKPLFVNYRGAAPDGDGRLAAVEDVDTVLDGIRDRIGDAGALLMMVGFVDGSADDPLLQVGINGSVGVLTYSSDEHPDGLISDGRTRSGSQRRGSSGRDQVVEGPIDDIVHYSFQGTKAEFPASAEVPYDSVKQAVKEFLAGAGTVPTAVAWRPDTD